ncbi:hypothetical protein BH23BAC3_BH23BAC3_05530 [soil metagenome]
MGFYNFYNPQFIPDQTGDGLSDILVANGGDFTVPPYDPNRPPGKLMVIASQTGELISEAYVPDGKETYMSAVVSKLHEDDEDYSVIYGTGGETMGGKLFRTTLSKILMGDISDSIELASSEDKGFIAPPVLADLNNDGFLDIAVNAVYGRILAFSGRDNSGLWKVQIENTEAYGSIAVGNFVDKERTDLFTTFSIGVWPHLRDNVQLLINGETGETLLRDTVGVYQTATPVVADFNNDGYDDALISINIDGQQFDGSFHYQHIMGILDFHNNRQYALDSLQPGANLASTPRVGDLDGNGKLDIIYSVLGDEKDIPGFKMFRLRSNFDSDKDVIWGTYMGSNLDGVYRRQ